ncbi:MAPEG family protein [Altererythrobacter sp.]|uniref:MAPEG family protein n=1 Tax=Altererythrobacter sp. TaxID=1872480 RepID=UPI001B0EEF8E|nr:MAPEG family protein [Altererythrobacter sp.]MBO6609675.1 MAPEG family protein [Altererythrobacter sp.]MBO6641175.1 MAPEG family protein [Altererythrobacter sp.]MBO6708127.1 MAPEG family protein [Altererythrobacter sp.]MBO6945738.1 MAPEG family protein [Altererythrobacter sp.]
MIAQMLAPAAVLIVWSIIMLMWTAGTRFPAMAKSGMDLKQAKPGGRGQDLEGVIPDKVNWKSHNYAHLMEQPTIFYPAVIILAMMGAGATDVLLAWVYVGLRIVHSLWQALVNIVAIRFLLFILSTLALTALAVRAVSVTLLADPGVL